MPETDTNDVFLHNLFLTFQFQNKHYAFLVISNCLISEL